MDFHGYGRKRVLFLLNKQKIHNPRRENSNENVEKPCRYVHGIFGNTIAFLFGFGIEKDDENLFKGQSDTASKADDTDERADAEKIQNHRWNHSQEPSVEAMNFKIEMKCVNHRRGEHEKRRCNGKNAKE